jgi:hypothetical protein
MVPRGITAVALGTLAVVAGAGSASATPPSDVVYHRLCRAIEQRHVAAIFRVPVAPIELGGASDCAFHPRGEDASLDGVRVFLRLDDGDRTLWLHRGDRSYGRFRSLGGLRGAQAKWGYLGGRLPSVVDARTGSFTCTVIPSAGSGFAAVRGAPLASALTFARRLLSLCADVFSAHR